MPKRKYTPIWSLAGFWSAARITHLWARYNMGGGLWTKKYLIVFGGIEYAITATCYYPEMLAEMEKGWDTIVELFRLSKESEKDIAAINSGRAQVYGELYARAYEAASRGQYSEACDLLKKCLDDNPDHILAHKELAFILKNTGDLKGALSHRLVVKRLDPSDMVNRFNLAGILAMLGESDNALREIDEVLILDPNNPRFVKLKRILE